MGEAGFESLRWARGRSVEEVMYPLTCALGCGGAWCCGEEVLFLWGKVAGSSKDTSTAGLKA